MADPQDIVDIPGIRTLARDRRAEPDRAARRFLSVWFRCCHTYGRMYRNRHHTYYVGHCPRCGARVRARIGLGGTDRRMFEAR